MLHGGDDEIGLEPADAAALGVAEQMQAVGIAQQAVLKTVFDGGAERANPRGLGRGWGHNLVFGIA